MPRWRKWLSRSCSTTCGRCRMSELFSDFRCVRGRAYRSVWDYGDPACPRYSQNCIGGRTDRAVELLRIDRGLHRRSTRTRLPRLCRGAGRRGDDAGRFPARSGSSVCACLRQRGRRRGAGSCRPMRRSYRDSADGCETLVECLGFGRSGFVGLFLANSSESLTLPRF